MEEIRKIYERLDDASRDYYQFHRSPFNTLDKIHQIKLDFKQAISAHESKTTEADKMLVNQILNILIIGDVIEYSDFTRIGDLIKEGLGE